MTPVPLILSISIVYCTVHTLHHSSRCPLAISLTSQTIAVLLIHISNKTIWCAQYPLSHITTQDLLNITPSLSYLLNVCELNLPQSA